MSEAKEVSGWDDIAEPAAEPIFTLAAGKTNVSSLTNSQAESADTRKAVHDSGGSASQADLALTPLLPTCLPTAKKESEQPEAATTQSPAQVTSKENESKNTNTNKNKNAAETETDKGQEKGEPTGWED